MLDQLNDLAFGDAADLVQMQAPLAFDFSGSSAGRKKATRSWRWQRRPPPPSRAEFPISGPRFKTNSVSIMNGACEDRIRSGGSLVYAQAERFGQADNP